MQWSWALSLVGCESGPRLHGPGLTSGSTFTSMSQIKACPGDKIIQSNPIFSNVYVNLLCCHVTHLDVNVLQYYYFLTTEEHKAMVQNIRTYYSIGKKIKTKIIT